MSVEPPGPRSPLSVAEVGLCPSLIVHTRWPGAGTPEHLVPWLERLAPLFLLHVGNGCNQNCVHCTLDRRGAFRTTPDEAKAQAMWALDNGMDVCSLTGGEPTVWPHLFAVLAAIKKMGVRRCVMHTNGLMLSYPRYLPRLEEHGVDTLVVSYDHFDPDRLRLLTQRDDTPELLDVALDHLAASPIQTILHTVCTGLLDGSLTLHARHMLSTADAFRETPSVLFSPLRHPNLESPAFDALAWRYSDLMPQLRAAVDTLAPHLPVMLKGFPICLAGPLAPLCLENYVLAGRVDPQSGEFLSPVTDSQRPGCCLDCQHRQRCPGVPSSYVRRFGLEEFPKGVGAGPHEFSV